MEMNNDKKVYLFELDDVLYPKKDYVLQVYYLLSNFIEYTEGKPISKEVLQDLKEYYLEQGEKGNIDHIIAKYKLSKKIKENYERLFVNAQLPLKLELFPSAVLYIGDLLSKNKGVGVLTKGNPVGQLNKIRQVNWKGLDAYLKVYFADELRFRKLKPYLYIAEEFGVLPGEVEHITSKPILK